MKTVVSFGDEYCFGINSAASLLAEKMNCGFIDKARKDTSNFKIHRDIVKYISDNNIENCFFLIGWTSPKKWDIYWKESYFTLNKKETKYFPTLFNKLSVYYDYLFDEILLNNQWASDIFSVQQIFQNLNIKYFMYNTTEKLKINRYNEPLVKLIDTKFYLDPLNSNLTYTNYVKNKGFVEDNSKEANLFFSDFIFNKIDYKE